LPPWRFGAIVGVFGSFPDDRADCHLVQRTVSEDEVVGAVAAADVQALEAQRAGAS